MKKFPMGKVFWPTRYTGAVAIGLVGAFFFSTRAIQDVAIDFTLTDHTYIRDLIIAGAFAVFMLWGAIMDYRKRPC